MIDDREKWICGGSRMVSSGIRMKQLEKISLYMREMHGVVYV